MKDLLSKDHYCYKIYTLLIKAIAYSPRLVKTPIWSTPYFYRKNIYPSYYFIKILKLPYK